MEFEQIGIKAVDALHLALAEAGEVDYFSPVMTVSTDVRSRCLIWR